MEEILKAQENDPIAESCDGEKEHCVPTDAEPNVADVTVHEEGASGIAGETEDAFSAEADFEEIIGLFPELAITEPACIAHADRYGELRRMGLSVREAFLATNTELVKREAAAAGESRARAKAHLTGIGRRSGRQAALQ